MPRIFSRIRKHLLAIVFGCAPQLFITAAAQTVDVIEYYNASQDHYFISSLQPDIDALDSGKLPGWQRTGR